MWKTCGKASLDGELMDHWGLINAVAWVSNRDQRHDRRIHPLDRWPQVRSCSGKVVMQCSCSCKLSCPE